jgi:hypothetical protein
MTIMKSQVSMKHQEEVKYFKRGYLIYEMLSSY